MELYEQLLAREELQGVRLDPLRLDGLFSFAPMGQVSFRLRQTSARQVGFARIREIRVHRCSSVVSAFTPFRREGKILCASASSAFIVFRRDKLR